MSVPTSLMFKTLSNRKAFSSRSFVLKLNPHQSFKKVPIEASQAHAVVGKQQDFKKGPMFVIFLIAQNVIDLAW